MLVFLEPGHRVMGCLLSKEDLKYLSQEELGQLVRQEAQRKKDSEKYLVETEIIHDPWGPGEKIDLTGVDFPEVHGDEKENVSIIDLRAAHSAIQNVQNSASKHSESQTEPADGVDFDWDLTDKTDTETQV